MTPEVLIKHVRRSLDLSLSEDQARMLLRIDPDFGSCLALPDRTEARDAIAQIVESRRALFREHAVEHVLPEKYRRL